MMKWVANFNWEIRTEIRRSFRIKDTITTLLMVRSADLTAALGVLLVVTPTVENLAGLLGGEVLLTLHGLGLGALAVALHATLLGVLHADRTELALNGSPASLLEVLLLLCEHRLCARDDFSLIIVHKMLLHETSGGLLSSAVHHLSTRADCQHFTHGIHINAEKNQSLRWL